MPRLYIVLGLIVSVMSTELSTDRITEANKTLAMPNSSTKGFKGMLISMVKHDLSNKLGKIDHAIVNTITYKSGYFYRFMKEYLTLLLKFPPRLLKLYVKVLNQELISFESDIYDQELIEKISYCLNVASEKDGFKIKNVLVVYRLLLLEEKPARRDLIEYLNKMYVLSDWNDIKLYLEDLNNFRNYARVNISDFTRNALKSLIFNKIRAHSSDIADRIKETAIEYGSQDTFKPTKESFIRHKRSALRSKEHMFSDFLVDFFGTLSEYEPEKLMKTIEILDVEFRNYNYEGCKFNDIFNYETRAHYNTFFTNLGLVPDRINVTLAILKRGFETRDPSFAATQLGKFALFLDHTYNLTDKYIFNDIIIGMEEFKTNEIDTTALFRNGFRAILFDHVTNMTDDERMQMKAVMDTHNAQAEQDLLKEEHKKHQESQQSPGFRQMQGGNEGFLNPQFHSGRQRSRMNREKDHSVYWEGNLDVIFNFFK